MNQSYFTGVTQPAPATETVIDDLLKEDLSQYDRCIEHFNRDIEEYIKLRNTIQILQTHFRDGFKTQVPVGDNMFVQGRVDRTDRIFVDIGLKCYVEFSLDEALKFCDIKIKILTKKSNVIREASIVLRARIKMNLMFIGQQNNLYNLTDVEE